ncbi:MAG: hypothetical protein KAH32_04000 [Chlamydiia bacterium]|nr:hypothetical protein [Chlamydiia bacterium]
MVTLNSLDCAFLAYLCQMKNIAIDNTETIRFMTNSLEKSSKCRYRILCSRMSKNPILSHVGEAFGLEASNLLDEIIGTCSSIVYTLSSTVNYSDALLDSYQLISECISSARMCVIMLDKVIAGADEIFTNRKIERIKNMLNTVKNAYAHIHSEYSKTIQKMHECLHPKSYKEIAFFFSWMEALKQYFHCFKCSFMLTTRAAITIKSL